MEEQILKLKRRHEKQLDALRSTFIDLFDILDMYSYRKKKKRIIEMLRDKIYGY